MAGSLESTEKHQNMAMNAIIEQWEVQFSRFMCFPATNLMAAVSTLHPLLTPHSAVWRKRRRGGVWISTPSATVKFISDCSNGSDESILMVTLGGKLMEEHYTSWLHLTWPQVSCLSGFPPRGARAVILSYKDSEGQIQKFALRFSTIEDTERFIEAVKVIMKGSELPSAEFNSGPSSQSEFTPFSELPYRDKEDYGQSDSADISSHQMTSHSEAADQSNAYATIPTCGADEFISDFPPSFSSFLMNCCPAAGQANPRTTQEVDFKSEFAKYMEDSSFQDLLIKVEEVMNELGDNINF